MQCVSTETCNANRRIKMCKNLEEMWLIFIPFLLAFNIDWSNGKTLYFRGFFFQFSERRFIISRFKIGTVIYFWGAIAANVDFLTLTVEANFFGTYPMEKRERRRGSKRLKTVWKWFLTFIADEISEYTQCVLYIPLFVILYAHCSIEMLETPCWNIGKSSKWNDWRWWKIRRSKMAKCFDERLKSK